MPVGYSFVTSITVYCRKKCKSYIQTYMAFPSQTCTHLRVYSLDGGVKLATQCGQAAYYACCIGISVPGESLTDGHLYQR